jgi:RND superfamily putative drug exporter
VDDSQGLSVDYDVFGIDRVMEYRNAGFTTHDAVLCGLAQTGKVVTAAGAIMFFAFAGLLLSSNAALNQLSFFLCVSVLADCFVVRTLLVPSLMMLLGETNWWPSKPAVLDY